MQPSDPKPEPASSALEPACGHPGSKSVIGQMLHKAIAREVERLSPHLSLLLISPCAFFRRKNANHHPLEEVSLSQLTGFEGCVDVVVDVGYLAEHGLVFHLTDFKWDVLGKLEEALHSIYLLLSLVKTTGRLLMMLSGEPIEYLEGCFEAFTGVTVQEARQLSGPPPGEMGFRQIILEVFLKHSDVVFGPAALEVVLDREFREERSHHRYASLLDEALARLACFRDADLKTSHLPLNVLDVGGGDGHMAEWWGASGHNIHVLEVDRKQVEKAQQRLGKDSVTFHDGVSSWPFEDRSFDVCLLLFVLHHIMPEAVMRRTLREARRVTRGKIIILEDCPFEAKTPGLQRLGAAVTAEHFRPFGQDPQQYMRNIRPDSVWKRTFSDEGLTVESVRIISGTLQHPCPHLMYILT